MGAGYKVTARGNREAEILIYEDVGESFFGGVSAKQFHQDLRALGALDTLNVRLNSYGGEVFDGLAIYRHLAEHAARKIVHVDGIAASIASVIAMAGDEIHISEAGRIMIHDAAGGVRGTADEMRRQADLLDAVTGSIADIYVARTGQETEAVRQWMKVETWFTAAEAIENGFATATAPNVRMAARLDPQLHAHIKRAPKDLLAAVPRPARDSLSARLQNLRARITDPAR